MDLSVSIKEKKLFLEWFLYQYGSNEFDWFLEDIIQDECKLENIHFVDSIHDCPKGVQIKIGEFADIQFMFFKGSVKTKDVYTAFHELQLYENEALYVQFDFPDKHSNTLYSIVNEAQESMRLSFEHSTNMLLDHLIQDSQKNFLKEKINQALDNRNDELFTYYSTKYKKIKGM